MPPRFLPILAAACTGILVGAAIVATRFVVGESSPASLALLRYAIGVCCFFPLLLLRGGVSFRREDLLPIALLGITQFGIVVTLLNYALLYIPSARAALIFAVFPLLTMLIAAAVGQERISGAKALGVVLTIGGVVVALGEAALGSDGVTALSWGELAAFGSALAGAVCSVLYRPYLRRYPTLPVSAYAMLASVVFLALPAGAEGFFSALPDFSPAGWLAVLFIGVSSGVGYYLWLWALGHSSATDVSMFLALNPIAATALGALLLGEQVSTPFLLALGLVAIGLWIAQRWQG